MTRVPLGRSVLEEALGSRSKARLVRALARRVGEEATTEELVQATGQSTGTIVPALQQLVAAGVVDSRTVGRTRTYRLHERHPLFPSLRRLMEEESAAIDRVCDEVGRRATPAGLRFAAWAFGERQGDGASRSVVVLHLIGDDAKVIESAVQPVVAPHAGWLVHRAWGEAEARAALAAGDAEFARVVEHGRVVYADAEWLA